jgi:hypothetical protein
VFLHLPSWNTINHNHLTDITAVCWPDHPHRHHQITHPLSSPPTNVISNLISEVRGPQIPPPTDPSDPYTYSSGSTESSPLGRVVTKVSVA